jgi:hypothetical protein
MKIARPLKLLASLFTLPPCPAAKIPAIADVGRQARREWHAAHNYFNAISDADLTDYAIYLMQAAEKKYTYLIKQARRESASPGNKLSHDRTAKLDYNKV